MKRKKLNPEAAPIECTSTNALAAIKRDNVEVGDFWMLTDGYSVTVTQQKVGESPTANVSVPKPVFDAFVRWYTTGVWRKPRTRRAGAQVAA